MATRAYRRDNRGRFAGSGGGTNVTYGKAGGFANAAFRSRVQAQRASASKSLGGAAGAKGRGSRSKFSFKATAKRAAVSGIVIGGSAAVGVGLAAVSNKALVAGVGIKKTPKPSGPHVFDPLVNRGPRIRR